MEKRPCSKVPSSSSFVSVYWVVKFPQLIGWRDKKREMFETVYPNTDLIYVGALITVHVSTCMWPHYTGDERDANDAL